MEAAASMCSHGGDHLPASNNGIAAGASSAAAAGSNFVSGDVDKDGPEPVPPSSSSSHTHFDLSQTFMSLRTLLAAAEAFAKAGGWIIKYRERAYCTSENWPHDTPFEEEAKEASCLVVSPESEGCEEVGASTVKRSTSASKTQSTNNYLQCPRQGGVGAVPEQRRGYQDSDDGTIDSMRYGMLDSMSFSTTRQSTATATFRRNEGY